MRRILPWLVTVALLVGAWLIAGATPDGEERLADPFPVAAQLGEPLEADNLGVTVHDVRLTEKISTGGWHAEGTWLVVSLDAWLVQREAASLKRAYLIVGERSFLASERVAAYDSDAALSGWGLHVGIPQSGTLQFELPDGIADDPDAAHAVLQLALGTPLSALSPAQNQQGAAVAELAIDLTAVARADEIELPDTSWSTQ